MSELIHAANDPPADSATHGYSLNHLALIVHDIDAMLHFYGTVLGMRKIMTCQISSSYRIIYLGYPSGQDFQTGEELKKEMRYRDGLLEFLHPVGSPSAPSEHRVSRFSHIGFVVPDVVAVEQRMKDYGVPILKGLAMNILEPDSQVADWWGLSYAQALEAEAGVRAIDFGGILLVRDPDGNIVEVQKRE